MVRIVALAGIVGAALLSAGCTEEATIFSSPDGRYDAVLLNDRGGGAASSAYQSIELRRTDTGERQVVLEGENLGGRATANLPFGDVNISWVAPRSLLIEYCGGDILKHVTTAFVGDAAVNIGLAKEARGDWPITTPTDRRAGPPPCR
jgi:hypothetical protein